MDDRRQTRGNGRRSRSRHGRPPPPGNLNSTVPAWEKEFCRVVGTLDWETIVQAKRFTDSFDNIIEWEDSAVKESFDNAKSRYWAKINDLHYNVPMPNPNLYIDEINWDSTEVIPDIDDDCLLFVIEEEHKPVVIFGDAFVQNVWDMPPGWDLDEDLEVRVDNPPSNFNVHAENLPIIPTGWGDEDEVVDANFNWGGPHQGIEPTGWGDGNEDVNQNIEPMGQGDEEGDPVAAHAAYQDIGPTGCGDLEENIQVSGHVGDSQVQNWGYPYNYVGVATMSVPLLPDYYNAPWQYSEESRLPVPYVAWGQGHANVGPGLPTANVGAARGSGYHTPRRGPSRGSHYRYPRGGMRGPRRSNSGGPGMR